MASLGREARDARPVPPSGRTPGREWRAPRPAIPCRPQPVAAPPRNLRLWRHDVGPRGRGRPDDVTAQVSVADTHRFARWRVRYTADTVPIAVITFDFDPLLRLREAPRRPLADDRAGVVIAAALIAGRPHRATRSACGPTTSCSSRSGSCRARSIGGRSATRSSTSDSTRPTRAPSSTPPVGGLELGLAVVGGLLTAPVRRPPARRPVGPWSQVAVLPLLLALGAGKLTMVLGGAGQGLPSDLAWATAYLGPGPWGSLAPALPSHPSQAYEGIGTLVVLLVFVLVLAGAGLGAFLADGRGLAHRRGRLGARPCRCGSHVARPGRDRAVQRRLADRAGARRGLHRRGGGPHRPPTERDRDPHGWTRSRSARPRSSRARILRNSGNARGPEHGTRRGRSPATEYRGDDRHPSASPSR